MTMKKIKIEVRWKLEHCSGFDGAIVEGFARLLEFGDEVDSKRVYCPMDLSVLVESRVSVNDRKKQIKIQRKPPCPKTMRSQQLGFIMT